MPLLNFQLRTILQPKTTQIIATITAALSLVPIVMISFSENSANAIYSPAPLFVVLPYFFIPHIIAMSVPALIFLLWNWYLLKSREIVPKRTSILFFILAGLSIPYFITSWSYGIQYQGENFTRSICIINIVCIIILGIIWFIAIKAKHYITNFAFSWALFLWLFWYAFPYLGEWP